MMVAEALALADAGEASFWLSKLFADMHHLRKIAFATIKLLC